MTPKNDTIAKLVIEADELHERLAKVNKAIDAIRDVCDHNWIDGGDDSRQYVCDICGAATRI